MTPVQTEVNLQRGEYWVDKVTKAESTRLRQDGVYLIPRPLNSGSFLSSEESLLLFKMTYLTEDQLELVYNYPMMYDLAYKDYKNKDKDLGGHRDI